LAESVQNVPARILQHFLFGSVVHLVEQRHEHGGDRFAEDSSFVARIQRFADGALQSSDNLVINLLRVRFYKIVHAFPPFMSTSTTTPPIFASSVRTVTPATLTRGS